MNLTIKILLLLSNLFVINLISAQKALRPLPQTQWHIQKSDYATGNSFTKSSFRKNINYLPNGGVVVAANFNNEQGGAVRMDETGKVLWNLKLKGVPVGVGRMNNDFILFYSDEDLKGAGLYSPRVEVSSTIRASIINGETGKLIKDILVYDNGDRVYIESKPLNRPDGSFASLFVRVTDFKKGTLNQGKEVEQKLSSPKILLVGVDDKFNVNTTKLNTPGQEGLFVGAELGADDNLFFSSILKDELIVERFNRSGEVIKKLSAPLVVRTTWNDIESITTIDPKNQNSIFLALGYTKKNKDNAHQMFEFNFGTNKVSGSGEQELNKDYQKTFEVSEIKEIQNSSKYDGVDGFALMNFLVSDDKIIIIKGYHASPIVNNKPRFTNEKVGIEIFDRNWQRLKGIILDRKFETFDPACRSVGANINAGKLYMILPALLGVAKVGTVFAQIDLSSQKVEKYVVLEDPYMRRGLRGPVVESDASIWLKDGVLIENCGDESGFLSSKENISSTWQKVQY